MRWACYSTALFRVVRIAREYSTLNTLHPSRDPSTGWWCHSTGAGGTRISARLKRVGNKVHQWTCIHPWLSEWQLFATLCTHATRELQPFSQYRSIIPRSLGIIDRDRVNGVKADSFLAHMYACRLRRVTPRPPSRCNFKRSARISTLWVSQRENRRKLAFPGAISLLFSTTCIIKCYYIQSVIIMECFIHILSLLISALYAKCSYYWVLYNIMQSVLII